MERLDVNNGASAVRVRIGGGRGAAELFEVL
jgi:hypothetical protein